MEKEDKNEASIEGKVIEILPVKKVGKDKDKLFQQFVVSTRNGKYENQVLINSWGKMTGVTNTLNVGDNISIKANISSKRRGKEWTTDITVFTINIK